MYTQRNSQVKAKVMAHNEHADIETLLQQHPEYVSLLKVNTGVMQDAGINEGDVIAVDRNIPATDNSIVVAMLDQEMVIRKLEATGGKEILVTPGRRLAPLDVTGRLRVW